MEENWSPPNVNHAIEEEKRYSGGLWPSNQDEANLITLIHPPRWTRILWTQFNWQNEEGFEEFIKVQGKNYWWLI